MSALAVVTKPADQSTDDLDLVAAVRSGDDRAFELLFLRYQSRIAAYVRGMVRDDGRAEDITQEVFIAALRRIRETDREIAFKPWIYEIAKNACIDAFRRGRNTSEVSFDADEGLGASDRGRLVAAGASPDIAIDNKLALDNLCGAFGGLSQTHHEILVMREFEGLSYREIGERLGLSRAAVESTLFRARRRLSEEYEELVSGERCVRVRSIVDAPGGRSIGLRDQRRMARHISHCQPCRRYARRAGVELPGVARTRAASVAARLAGVLPLPPIVRRRLGIEDAGRLLGHHTALVPKWSASAVSALDPATVGGWSRTVAAVATVAVAGLSASAAVHRHGAVAHVVSRGPAAVLGSGGGAQHGGLSSPGATLRAFGERSHGQAVAGVKSRRVASGGAALSSRSGFDAPARDRVTTVATKRPAAAAPGAPATGDAGAGSDTPAPAAAMPADGASRSRSPAALPGERKDPVGKLLDGLTGSGGEAVGQAPVVPQAAIPVPGVDAGGATAGSQGAQAGSAARPSTAGDSGTPAPAGAIDPVQVVTGAAPAVAVGAAAGVVAPVLGAATGSGSG